MYNFPDITAVLSFALGAFFGIVGLLIASLAGIWVDMPSWAYLASFGIPAAVVGGWFQISTR